MQAGGNGLTKEGEAAILAGLGGPSALSDPAGTIPCGCRLQFVQLDELRWPPDASAAAGCNVPVSLEQAKRCAKDLGPAVERAAAARAGGGGCGGAAASSPLAWRATVRAQMALRRLVGRRMSVAVLQESGLGLLAKQLREHGDATVAKESRALLGAWKALVRQHQAEASVTSPTLMRRS